MALRKSAGGNGAAMAAAGAQHARRQRWRLALAWRGSWRRHGYNGVSWLALALGMLPAAYRRCLAIINGAA
jgi:hypothetical protein